VANVREQTSRSDASDASAAAVCDSADAPREDRLGRGGLESLANLNGSFALPFFVLFVRFFRWPLMEQLCLVQFYSRAKPLPNLSLVRLSALTLLYSLLTFAMFSADKHVFDVAAAFQAPSLQRKMGISYRSVVRFRCQSRTKIVLDDCAVFSNESFAWIYNIVHLNCSQLSPRPPFRDYIDAIQRIRPLQDMRRRTPASISSFPFVAE
jgi:hypothetical protein